MRRLDRLPVRTLLLIGAICLIAAGVMAQNWGGPGSLGLTVKSAKGKPLADAIVTIAYREVGFGDGPAPRRTTDQGEVAFVGLAEGAWSLKIDHPDHLSYLATVIVRRGKKTEVLSEFLEATGAGRLTLRVKLGKGASQNLGEPIETDRVADATPADPEPPRPTVEPPADRSPKPRPQPAPTPADQPKNEPAAETTEVPKSPPVSAPAPEPDVQADKPRAMPVPAAVPSPTPDPQPVALEPAEAEVEEPQAAVPASEPVTAVREPATEVEEPTEKAAERVEPAPMEPVPVQPAVEPAASVPASVASSKEPPTPSQPVSEPKIVPTPAEPEATVVAAEPSPASGTAGEPAGLAERPSLDLPEPAQLGSYGERTCRECKPGEWAVATTASVEALSANACDVTSEGITDQLRSVASGSGGQLRDYAGPLPADRLSVPTALERILNDDSCRLLVVAIPAGSSYTGFRLQAQEAGDAVDCVPERPCPIASARWLFTPALVESDDTSLVFGVFRNTAITVSRSATLTAYFLPPEGWRSGPTESE